MIGDGPQSGVGDRHSAVYWLNNLPGEPGHEQFTHLAIAARVAGLKGLPFRGGYAAPLPEEGPCYFVPDETITSLDTARSLGIRNDDDFFGGIAPHPFVATKAITHRLVGPEAAAPSGWSHDCGRRLNDAVLLGFTAFSPDDARLAATRLLERGPARLKPVRARAGRGQLVVTKLSELDRVIGELSADEMATYGLVVEEDLTDVTTFSVGQVRLAGIVASYWGTQRLTKDNSGQSVYAGSDLEVIRGDFDALLDSGLPAQARAAVVQARKYDAAAVDCYRDLCASRRNYDVALGADIDGQSRCGVLEQSWRIGGATPAEIVALEAFQGDPDLRAIHASSVEVYGGDDAIPADAVIFFSGDDEEVGRITKYARTGSHGRQ